LLEELTGAERRAALQIAVIGDRSANPKSKIENPKLPVLLLPLAFTVQQRYNSSLKL
jgi:hypothetical protein